MVTVRAMKDLEFAFAGECRAARRYSLFAEKAENDGFKNLAELFRRISEQEKNHASMHFKALDGVKSSKENLDVAIEGEHYEIEEMYTSMIKHCEKGTDFKAEECFRAALKDEKEHEKILKKVLVYIENGKDIPEDILKLI